MMNARLTLALAMLLVFTACKGTQSTDKQANKTDESRKLEVFEETPKRNERTEISNKGKRYKSSEQLEAPSKLIRLNDQKFKIFVKDATNDTTKNITKGAKVFNLGMKEFGIIKGTIVVVTNALEPSYSAMKIANNTYRITPSNNQSLWVLYKDLSQNSNYTTVELEIDYSPIPKNEIM